MASQEVTFSLVSTTQSVAEMMETIRLLPAAAEPALYVDLEGVNLCRHGTISLVTIYVAPRRHAYLVDVHTLQSAAFTTPAIGGDSSSSSNAAAAAAAETTTLGAVLESPSVTKVFFDVRNDSDALHAHFGLRLAGVEDLQLMENATRPAGRRRYLNGLDRCIQAGATEAPLAERLAWKATKEKGLALFSPRKGGSYEVFNARPLSEDVERYCVNDVKFLPLLRATYLPRLGNVWGAKVATETANRIRESQHPSYQPQSQDKKFGPWEKPLF